VNAPDALVTEPGESGDRDDFRRALLAGLKRRPRAIPPKFLYDARGSELFDRICGLPEYYLTRTETGILDRHAGDIARRAAAGCALIEFGSGSSVKSRLLLDAMRDKLALYCPIDISREHLDRTAASLRRDYPGLRIEAVCADYMAPVDLPAIAGALPKVGFFPGSTIGNLEPRDAEEFLRKARRLVGDTGALVLGTDLKKAPQVLHDAYNDSAGVTAAFTLNLLVRANRELGADFDVAAFAHDASYDPVEGRIEIYLKSLARQAVHVAGCTFEFAEGERLHAEYSYKYDRSQIEALARAGGFAVAEIWTDAAGYFAESYLVAR